MMWEGLNPPYATIVADPPWAYRTDPTRVPSRATAGVGGGYSTMTVSEVTALPVGDLAADNAHCYLWITNPIIGDGAADVLRAWGFTYVTMLTWRKTGTLGLGYYFRGDTEHVLFGIRGRAPVPPSARQRNWFEAPKTGHSRKPPLFFDRVEQVSPGPYVELFCREPRFGWDSWGKGYEGAA